MKAEINKRVYEFYPVTEKEKCCRIERQKMKHKREMYRKRLIEQSKEKMEYK